MRINKTEELLHASNDKDVSAMDIEQNDNQSKMSKDDEFDDNDFSRPQATFQFKIENFSKFSKQALSPPCYIRNLPWKILAICRFQEKPGITNKFLGYFLQCNAESESQTWSCQASAAMKIVAQDKEKGVDYCKNISHLFYSKENDWGYNQFLSFKELMDPEKAYYKDDSIILEVSVRAEAPHGVCWDSKKHTGYVGLKNQGATCYMNSLLQTLFFTNQLRKDVYQIPTEGDDAGKSVALALQRVFYELQTSDKPVGTKKVTKSFGWETLDSFMQHDVQEFCRVLLDKIESKMKGSLVEGKIPKLFEGKMVSYIKCKFVDYCSSCTEAFYDIQLNVKDMKNIYESFKQYITPQLLDGENKYDAAEHGLQDAEKGVKFVSFPPVLHLQLMRYEYDPALDTNVKINDRFEFPDQLNLDAFLDKPEATAATYILQAVLVHSGDNHGGHYVVYIDPKLDGKWCKFDDDVVSRCSKREAINANYGGSETDLNFMNQQQQQQQDPNNPLPPPAYNQVTNPPPPPHVLHSAGSLSRNTSNAYMLVYVRESAKDQVLGPVTEADIPMLLVERLKEEKRIELIKRKEKNEAHLYFNIDIFMEENFYAHTSHDLFDPGSHVKRSFKCRRHLTFKEFMREIANYAKFKPEQVRVWPLFKRSNDTIRFVPHDYDENKRLDEYIGGSTWTIFMETIIPDTGQDVLPPFDQSIQTLIFVKYYDPKIRLMFYCGHVYAETNKPLSDLAPVLRKRAGLPEDTALLYYEEISYSQTGPLKDPDRPLNKIISELLHGDIIVFQKETSDLASLPYPTPIHYFSDLFSHVDMTFADKNKINDSGFKLSFSMHMPYQEVTQYFANYIGVDKKLLQFFTSSPYRETPQNPIKSTFSGKIGDIFLNKPSIYKIFYQKLCMPLDELEAKTQYKCLWVSRHYKDEKEIVLYVNKSATVGDLIEDARKKILNSYLALQQSNGPNSGGRGSPNVVNSGLSLNTVHSNSVLGANNQSPLITNSDYFDSPDPQQLKLRVVDIFSFKNATILRPDVKLENYSLEQQQQQNLHNTPSNLNVASSLGSPISTTANQISPPGSLFSSMQHHNSNSSSNGSGGSMMSIMSSNNPLRIEEIPHDQRDIGPDEILVPCGHFYRLRDMVNTFGIPFFIKIKNDVHFEVVRANIQHKLDLPDKEFEKFKYFFVTQGRINEIVNTDCRISINDLKMAKDVWLGLEHQNKMAKQSRTSYMEKPIKIHN